MTTAPLPQTPLFPPNITVPAVDTSLSSRAMLCSLNISSWSGYKYDQQASEEIAEIHGAEKDSGRYNKRLVPRKELIEITKIIGQARRDHEFNTLPWAENGGRILPAAVYMEHMKLIRARGTEFWAAYNRLATRFEDLVRQQNRLGTLFNVEDYPGMRLEILPERILVRTAETLVWWMPATKRVMFFSDRGGDAALRSMNGKCYPHPPLVFKASGSDLRVRALLDNKRPDAKTILHMAPYWNSNQDGVVCTGSMKIPREKSVAAIEGWETAFFQSEFSHANGARTNHPQGILALWKSLQGKQTFPARYLFPVQQTLSEFVNPHDRTIDAQ